MKENLFKKYRNYILTLGAVFIIALMLIIGVAVNNANLNQPSEPVNTTKVEFILPIANATISKTYNAEELQYNNTLDCWEIHKGLDLVANAGDKVLACYDGKVTNIYTNYLEGTTIEITHEDGLISVYEGLSSETSVKVNDVVNVGDSIGTVANCSAHYSDDGSHVHFELIKDGEKIDPLNYIEISMKD